MLHLKTAKLAKWQVRLLCWSGGLLWSSGVAWLLLHYFGQTEGEFGPETNPVEPWALRLHGASMIAALLGVGSLLVVHIWRGWAYRRQRVVGAALATVVALLTLTGYLLYYVSDETLRAGVSIFHWVIGLATLPLFVVHYRHGRRIRNS